MADGCADLYGDINDSSNTNGTANGGVKEVPTGPARIQISRYDILTGVGKILDMEFGIAVTDEGVS